MPLSACTPRRGRPSAVCPARLRTAGHLRATARLLAASLGARRGTAGSGFPPSLALLSVSGLLQENVRAVLTSSTIDVLSHVAIRARTQKVSPPPSCAGPGPPPPPPPGPPMTQPDCSTQWPSCELLLCTMGGQPGDSRHLPAHSAHDTSGSCGCQPKVQVDLQLCSHSRPAVACRQIPAKTCHTHASQGRPWT